MPPFQIPDDIAALSDDELREFIASIEAAVQQVAADPASYVNDDLTYEALLAAAEDAVAARDEALAELSARATEDEPADDEPTTDEPETAAADAPADFQAQMADLASRAASPTPDPEPVVAAAQPDAAVPPLPRPAASRRRSPARPADARVPASLTAAVAGLGREVGDPVDGAYEIAEMMTKMRDRFGNIGRGVKGEKHPIAQVTYRQAYGDDRRLTGDIRRDRDKIEAVLDESRLRAELARRRGLPATEALTASGGLCAPVTPYYGLQVLAMADRPVRDALPSFNADRGGIRFAAPAALPAVTTGVGTRTVAQDAAGGTTAAKTCQVIACPPFTEVDVITAYHCLQFGNLGSRAFPELVAQWNDLVLAAQARTAETILLDGIDVNSTHVTAGNLGLGASASIPSQVLTAAAAIRSRQRMRSDAILRAMFPAWVLDMLVSDVYRSQFDRFDMTQADFVAMLRANNIEPTFYLDGATGRNQVFGAQSDNAALLPFPPYSTFYIFPEGTFLHLDGGTLELGLVRDSVLNATNDFQIFGETWENVAKVGVVSLAVISTTCDIGVVAGPKTGLACPVAY